MGKENGTFSSRFEQFASGLSMTALATELAEPITHNITNCVQVRTVTNNPQKLENRP